MKEQKTRIYTVDLFKFVASLFIIAIHANLFSDMNEQCYFVFVHIVCRQAVPFFAICTGFFLASKLEFNRERLLLSKDNTKVLLVHWKHYILLYVTWTLLYLIYSIPTWVHTDWFSPWAFVDYGIATVLKGSYYHLWYLLSLIYAIPLLFLCLKSIKTKYLFIPAVILYTIKILSYEYRAWLPNSMITLFNLSDRVSGIFDSAFCILPFLLIGVYINKKKATKKSYNIPGFLVCCILLITEAFILKSLEQEKFSYITLLLPSAYFLFCVIINMNIKVNKKICQQLGACSLIIYCVHPMILDLLTNRIQNSVILFIITAVVSTLLGTVYIKIKSSLRHD